MSSAHTDVVDLDVSVLSSPKYDLSLSLYIDHVDALAGGVLTAFFWKGLDHHVVMARQPVLKYANRPILKGDRVRVNLLANLALDDLPGVLDSAVGVGPLSHFSAHPLLEAGHMDQARGAFALTGIDQRVICVHHLIHQTDSARRYFFFLAEVHFSGMPAWTVVSRTWPLDKVHVDLLRRSCLVLRSILHLLRVITKCTLELLHLHLSHFKLDSSYFNDIPHYDRNAFSFRSHVLSL